MVVRCRELKNILEYKENWSYHNEVFKRRVFGGLSSMLRDSTMSQITGLLLMCFENIALQETVQKGTISISAEYVKEIDLCLLKR